MSLDTKLKRKATYLSDWWLGANNLESPLLPAQKLLKGDEYTEFLSPIELLLIATELPTEYYAPGVPLNMLKDFDLAYACNELKKGADVVQYLADTFTKFEQNFAADTNKTLLKHRRNLIVGQNYGHICPILLHTFKTKPWIFMMALYLSDQSGSAHYSGRREAA